MATFFIATLSHQPLRPGAHLPTRFAAMTLPDRTSTTRQHKADKELLFKGVTCTLIGLIVLLAPYFARSGSVREMAHQAAVVGWFALVLGGAFLVQYGLRQRAAGRRQP